MADKVRLQAVFECPVCGRQEVVIEGERMPRKPYICDIGHRRVEMEQRLADAYRAEYQSVDWERDLEGWVQDDG